MRRTVSLLCALLLLSCGLTVLALTRATVPKENYSQMREAAQQAETAFALVKEARLTLGYPIDPVSDPGETGLIGLPYSEITTTLGALESKRSSVNPNAAAMVVDMLSSLGLEAGDRVAVNLSGSFPAMNIAVLCAARAMELEVVSVSSVGASTYGANLPELTWPDMEQLLVTRGVLPTRSAAVSMGGQDDLGLEFPEEVRSAIAARLQAYGYPILEHGVFEENLAARLELYGEIAVFVNVGGNLSAFGIGSGLTTEGGVMTALPPGEQGNGLIQHYLKDGIPVVHLLNMKDLLPAYGLPYDPLTQPAVGEGALYWQRTKHPAAVLLSVCTIAAAGFLLWRGFHKKEGQGRDGA